MQIGAAAVSSRDARLLGQDFLQATAKGRDCNLLTAEEARERVLARLALVRQAERFFARAGDGREVGL